jgi:hypothetical protein
LHSAPVARSSRVHFADVSPSLPSLSSVSSLTLEISLLPAENLLYHDNLFHDIVEQVQLEESYSRLL